MSLPRDMLGPYPIRGLTALPRAYGEATVAENVEWDGDWCRTRKGTAPVIPTLGYVPSKITYCDEFRPRRGNPVLVVVGANDAGGHQIETYKDGSVTPYQNSSLYYQIGRPSGVDFQGYRVLFLPCDSTWTMWLIDGDANCQALIPDFTIPSGGDAGPYRGAEDPVRGTFGCVHLDRLFVVDDEDPSFIWYSNFQSILGWPLDNFLQPFGDAREPLTGLISFNGVILAFRRQGIAQVKFAGKGLSEIDVLKANTGAVCQQAICQAGNSLAWLSDDGLLFMDTTGNVTEDLAAPINPLLRQYQAGFGDATLRYFSYKRQLWLLIPSANRIFVLDMRSGNWSTIVAAAYDASRRHWAMGQQRSWDGQDLPILATTSALGGANAAVARFEASDPRDWVYGSQYAVVRSQWLSHGVPFEGQDLHRLYLDARIDFHDMGNHSDRVFWLTQGQAAVGDYLYSGTQYADCVMQTPIVVSRVGAAKVGTATVAADVGELDFEARAAFSGEMRGRWLQLGITSNTTVAPWAAKRFRLLTRVAVSKRER